MLNEICPIPNFILIFIKILLLMFVYSNLYFYYYFKNFIYNWKKKNNYFPNKITY